MASSSAISLRASDRRWFDAFEFEDFFVYPLDFAGSYEMNKNHRLYQPPRLRRQDHASRLPEYGSNHPALGTRRPRLEVCIRTYRRLHGRLSGQHELPPERAEEAQIRQRGHCRRLKSCLALVRVHRAGPIQTWIGRRPDSRPQFETVEQRFGGVRQPDARGMTCIRCQKAASVPRSSQSGPLRRPDDERPDCASDRQLPPPVIVGLFMAWEHKSQMTAPAVNLNKMVRCREGIEQRAARDRFFGEWIDFSAYVIRGHWSVAERACPR